jgi:HD-like signal output (HDOD) protein
MKARHLLTAAEIGSLRDHLDQRVESVGLASQPEIVLRLLDLVSDPKAQVGDYAKVIRSDPAVAGRVLRLANSAFFAQRVPITGVERACLVLGIERLKCVALGFHLSRAAICGSAGDLSRRVWGESVMRACLAGELARHLAPAHFAEAFVVGLMLDAGLPLMPRLVGRAYEALLARRLAPGALHRMESETLPFTHVDVLSALMRRWKLPEILSRAMENHHVRPPQSRADDTPARLHRIAWVVGNVPLTNEGDGAVDVASPTHLLGELRGMGLRDLDVHGVISRSVAEYSAAMTLFSDIATSLGEGEELVERVHSALVASADTMAEQSLAREHAATHRFVIAGRTLEAVREQDGSVVVILYDAMGQQLLTQRFPPGAVSSERVAEAFGLDLASSEDASRLQGYLRQRAA